jgi:hypothetical protein
LPEFRLKKVNSADSLAIEPFKLPTSSYIAFTKTFKFIYNVGGNSHPTIPHRFKDDQRLGSASADTQRDRGNGSTGRLYEVNIRVRVWMWRYGRGRPRMVSIADAETPPERIRSERVSESRTRAAETSKRRRASGIVTGCTKSWILVHTCMY